MGHRFRLLEVRESAKHASERGVGQYPEVEVHRCWNGVVETPVIMSPDEVDDAPAVNTIEPPARHLRSDREFSAQPDQRRPGHR
jgi:hypothetical protein